MKICYLNYYNPLKLHGGAERLVLIEAQLIAQNGNDVVIITTHSGKSVRTEKLWDGKISIWFLPSMRFKNSSFIQKCADLVLSLYNPFFMTLVDQILQIEKPDIVHIHNPVAMSISVAKVARRHGCKIVQTFHGYNFECPKGSLYRRSGVVCSNPLPICKVYKRVFRNIIQDHSSMIALNSFVRERMIKAGYDPAEIDVIPGTVTSIEFYGSRYDPAKIEVIPNNLQESHKTFLSRSRNKEILFVGRMVKAKGVHVLLNALAKVKKTFNGQFVVNLIGDGEDKAYFESQARSLGVNANFLGNVSDRVLHKHYKEACAVVIPSLWCELFPVVVLEAMSHGKPVIASNIGGFPDLVLHGQTGLLFEPANEDALASCIKTLLAEEELASKMGHNALEMLPKFSDTNHLKKLMSLYNKVMLLRDS
jgi:glycosyltransferase involved in cell wall biosynthesis